MPSTQKTANVSLDLERARLTSSKDMQAETEVHHLLPINAITCALRVNNSASRPIHLASSTLFSKLYRAVILADVTVAPNLPEFY